MLKKLRIRFICINMSIVIVMLCVIFGLFLHTTHQRIERENISILQTIATDPSQRFRPGEDFESGSIPYFVVKVTDYNEAIIIDDNNFDLSDEEFLIEIISQSMKGSDSGELPEYNLRFYRFQDNIIFADTSGEERVMQSLWRTSLLVGISSLLAFLGISILLARWAVKPVDKAWTEQKQFVSDASHELKTPLTVILTNADLLKKEDTSPAEVNKHADNILTMSNQMRGLVESLLELARVDNGAVKKTFETLNLSALVEDAILPFEPLLYEAGLQLNSTIEPDIQVKGSSSHLTQVVDILLDNAQKYSVAPGDVQINLRKTDHNHCILSLFSPGEPLSEEECENIFRRFYRVDKVRAMNHSYGLGLAIADSIIQEHNGKIQCEGQPKGNVFTIKLPLA